MKVKRKEKRCMIKVRLIEKRKKKMKEKRTWKWWDNLKKYWKKIKENILGKNENIWENRERINGKKSEGYKWVYFKKWIKEKRKMVCETMWNCSRKEKNKRQKVYDKCEAIRKNKVGIKEKGEWRNWDYMIKRHS